MLQYAQSATVQRSIRRKNLKIDAERSKRQFLDFIQVFLVARGQRLWNFYSPFGSFCRDPARRTCTGREHRRSRSPSALAGLLMCGSARFCREAGNLSPRARASSHWSRHWVSGRHSNCSRRFQFQVSSTSAHLSPRFGFPFPAATTPF